MVESFSGLAGRTEVADLPARICEGYFTRKNLFLHHLDLVFSLFLSSSFFLSLYSSTMSRVALAARHYVSSFVIGLIRKPTSFVRETSRAAVTAR
ncbi:hypothetical protein FJU30_21310 [Affinibrenneria salicis]|uniref:Uncharacterized protein n=1 Tax=Affinibrenneria salicis TaxID=2590031 RepID=A0A5J5FTZ3_9GAMM|nr:hypothetical protein [Affinibrenneria salicis]KAA8996739.1 hypothetical protein FJU30_21310 [Affinibrenneria salicis]